MAVRLLATVRASNGQELLSGWVCGFEESSARELIAKGLAVAHVEGVEVQVTAPPPEEPTVAYVGEAGVVNVFPPQAPAEASSAAPQQTRRRKG